MNPGGGNLAIMLVVGLLAGAIIAYSFAAAPEAAHNVTSTLFTTATTTSTQTLTSTQTFATTRTVESVSATSTVTSTVWVYSFSVSTQTLYTTEEPYQVAGIETSNITRGEGLVAVNANASRIYVGAGSSLFVVNASSGMEIAKLALPGDVAGIAIDVPASLVFVSVQDEILEISSTTNTVIGDIPVNAGSLAYDPSTNMIWGSEPSYTNEKNGTLLEVNPQTLSLVANITWGLPSADIAVNPSTNMVYGMGCTNSFVCESEVTFVNGTSGTIARTVNLGSAYFGELALNPVTGIVYVSGMAELVALNGETGDIIFQVYPQTCGPFLDMQIDPVTDQLFVVMQNDNYVLVFDDSGTLVNMYSFPIPPWRVAYDQKTQEIYVSLQNGQLVSFPNESVTGNINPTLIGAGQGCLLP